MTNGRVFNYTEEALVVYLRGDCESMGYVLGPGDMTPEKADPDVFVHLDADANSIRGHQNGWKIEPNCRTYVYRKPGRFPFGPVEHDLHCIPSDITRLEPAYTKVALRPASGAGSDFGLSAPMKGDHDGFQAFEWQNTFAVEESPGVECRVHQSERRLKFRFRETRTARFIRSGLEITVRIKPTEFAGLQQEERMRMPDALRRALADYWNRAVNPTGSKKPLRFRAEWVDKEEDATVQLRSGSDVASKAGEWRIDMTPAALAHEYGHLLGLMDEKYLFRRLELRNKRVVTLAEQREAERRDFPDRSARRIVPRGNEADRKPNIMESVEGPEPSVDQTLVDSVYTARNVQVLRFR